MANSGYTQTPDTLQSNAILRVQEVISEGPILGLVNGLQSVHFNGTPLRNTDNTNNFQSVAFDFRTGTANQDYMPGFPDVEDDVTINTQVYAAAPVVHETTTTGIDAMRVTLQFPQGLQVQYADSTGSGVKGGLVNMSIDVAPLNGAWTTVMNPTISGKASSSYEVAYRVEAPASAKGGLWFVRVRRVTADSTDSLVTDKVYVARITEIQDLKLNYPNTAYVGTTVSAQSVGNSIPVRTFDMKGLTIPVPINYNALARTYTGNWDGATFQTSWSDNPALCTLAMIRNSSWGLGNIDDSQIDFMSFYNAAQYCDQMVDDGTGKGTQEPRFTFNAQIVQPAADWSMIQQMGASFHAVISAAPLVTCYQDRPSSVVKMLNNSMVKDGIFTYQGTSGATRYTQCNVTLNDATDKFLPKTVTYQDPIATIKYGNTKTDVQGFGITSMGQARRHAKYVIDCNLYSTETVSYTVGLNQLDVEPYDIIEIMDVDYANAQLAGVIQGGTSTSFILDRTVPLRAGVTYTFHALGGDGQTIQSGTISNTGNVSTVTLMSPMPGGSDGNSLKGHPFIIYSTSDVAPRYFRVIGITEPTPGEVTVNAVQYDSGRYGRVEGNASDTTPPTSRFDGSTIKAPANVKFQVLQFVDPILGNRVRIHVSWDQVTQNGFADYVYQYRYNNGPYTTPTQVSVNSFDIVDAQQGEYDVILRTETVTGAKSNATIAVYNYIALGRNGFNAPIGLSLAPGTGTGTAFNGGDLSVVWTAPTGNTVGLASYELQFFDQLTNTLIYNAVVPSTQLAYTFKFTTNAALVGGPFRLIRIDLYSVDVQGLISQTAASVVFDNPAPTVPTISTTSGNGQVNVVVNPPPSDPDFVGTAIWMSQTSGFTPSAGNLVTYTPGVVASFPAADGTYYFRVACYDAFGLVGLNLTGEQSISVTNFDLHVIPDTVSNVKLTSALITAPDGSQTANVTVTWTGPSNVTPVNYSIKIREMGPLNFTGYTTIITTGSPYTFTGLVPSEEYGVRVIANNVYTSSIESDEVTIYASKDTTGPAAPTSLTINSSFHTNFLNWIDPTAADLDHVEVWQSSSNDRSKAKNVGQASAGMQQYGDGPLTTGAKFYYWIRAVDTSGNTSPFTPTSTTGGLAGTTIGLASADYQNLSIVNAAIANAAVDTAQIADAAITNAKIASAAITDAKIKNGTITNASIANGTITSAQIAVASITDANIASGTITNASIKKGTITNAEIGTGTIIEANIKKATITSASIASGTITGTLLANNTIAGTNILNGTITGGNLANNTITNAHIVDASLDGNTKIAHASIGTLLLGGNAVTVPTSAYTDAGISIGATATAVQSLSFVADGVGPPAAPVVVTYSQLAQVQNSGNTGVGHYTITIYRYSLALYSVTLTRTGGDTTIDTIQFIDQPPQGPQQYAVYLSFTGTSTTVGLTPSLTVSKRSLVTFEARR